jgi:hypothetical protein
MKKIAGVIAILLSIIVFLIHRQWTNSHTKAIPPKVSVPGILQENILLSSMLIQ